MREIKFRGKDLDGQFVYGNLHRNNNNTKFWITAMEQWNTIDKMTVCKYLYTKEIFEVEPKTVGQFTGTKDMLGKEIYEGDKVIYTLNHDSSQKEIEAEIEWHNHAWRLNHIWLLTEIRTIKVVGDVY